MELWSVRKTAQKTDSSTAFWRKLVHLKLIPVVRVGRAVRLNSEDVLAYLAARTTPAVKNGRAKNTVPARERRMNLNAGAVADR